MVMLDGLDTDRSRDMRLARAGTGDQHDLVGIVEEVAAMKLCTRASLSSLLAKTKLPDHERLESVRLRADRPSIGPLVPRSLP